MIEPLIWEEFLSAPPPKCDSCGKPIEDDQFPIEVGTSYYHRRPVNDYERKLLRIGA